MANELASLPPHAKKVFQGVIFSVWQWEQKLYDGSTATFEGLKRAGASFVVGVLPDKKIMLAYDEQPDRGPVITPAGGRTEAGETPEQTARREFQEETGYEIGKLKPWIEYSPSNRMAWTWHIFVGQELKKTAEPKLDPGEKVEPRLYTLDEFLHLGNTDELRDTVLRIKLLQALLDPAKKQELYDLFYS